jgi:hypothetical protein
MIVFDDIFICLIIFKLPQLMNKMFIHVTAIYDHNKYFYLNIQSYFFPDTLLTKIC